MGAASAAGNVVAHQLPGAYGHAHSGHGSLEREIEMFELQLRSRGLGLAAVLGPGGPGARARAALQQGRIGAQPGRVLLRGAVAPLRQAIGPADRAYALCEQRFGMAACGKGEIVAPYGQVDPVRKREQAAAGHQVQLQLGMHLLELWPAWNQPAHQQGGFAGQHPAARMPRACAQLLRRLAHALQSFMHGLCEMAPSVGQEDAAAAAVKQGHAQIVFQQAHGPADGAVGQMQLFSCLAEVLPSGGCFEAAQGLQRRQPLAGSL